VSNLALTSEDDDIESALKLAQVDIYNRRLRERARKKRIARDYKLIQEFFRKFENGKGKSLNQTKDERGLRLSLKNFRQFYTNDSYERLIQSLERERILRIRLTELCRYRWNGLTKIDECEHFERHAAANQHRSTGPFGHGKTVSIVINPLYTSIRVQKV
jgi:transcriptional adapter 2-beta